MEVDFFGEEDTRSNMMRLVSQRLTKIVNIPNMKDHGAAGATGCLKNVAYGCFSNVARSHSRGQTHTRTSVGTFASVEPLRSRCVLQIMDGIHAVWHGGPFAKTTRYVFHPRRILFGTDPVAIDRLLLDVIDDKRKAEGAISIWDRSPKYLKFNNAGAAGRRPQREHPDPRAGPRGVRGPPRPGGRRPREDPRGGDRGVSLLLFLATLPALYWAQPVETAPAVLKQAGIERLCVPTEAAAAWPPPGSRSSPSGRRTARSGRSSRPPACAPRAEVASASARPWVFANGWRFLRRPGGRYWGDVPAGKAALAAAEVFAYGADAVLAIDPADLEAPAGCWPSCRRFPTRSCRPPPTSRSWTMARRRSARS